jgi:hypothetical protein
MRTMLAAGVAALALATIGTGTAAAKDGDVIREGLCSGRSDWKLKLSEEDGRIETEFEVDSNVNGQRWNTLLRHNGVVVAQAVKVTKLPSGSFEFRRVLPNRAGNDQVVGRAQNPNTGEICRGTATWTA